MRVSLFRSPGRPPPAPSASAAGPHDDLTRLARKAAGGDRESAAALLSLLAPSMLASVRSVLGVRHGDLEDVLQSAFVRTLESLSDYRDQGSLHGFACRIATRTAIDHLRRVLGRGKTPIEFTPMPDLPVSDGDVDPLEQVSATLFIRDLAEEQAETLVLRLVLGYSVEEIAACTAVPINTVRSRLRRSRAAMRALLGINDGEAEEGSP